MRMANYLFDKDENGAGLGSMANRPRALDEPEGGILRRVEFAFLLLDDMTMAIPLNPERDQHWGCHSRNDANFDPA